MRALFDKEIHTREIPRVCRYQGVKAGLELLQEEFGPEEGSESVCLWRLRPDSDTTCVFAYAGCTLSLGVAFLSLAV